LGILLALLVCVSPIVLFPPSGAAATSPCSAARELQRLGRLNAAEAAYLEALKASSVSCASTGLERIANHRAGRCAKAEALAAAGQTERAEASYAKALEARPNSKCASEGLAGLEDKQDTWDRVGNATKNLTSLLALVAIGAVLVLLALQLVVQVLTRTPRVRRWKPVRRLVRSGLEVNPADDAWMTEKMGGQVASLLREQITPRHGFPGTVSGYTDLSNTLKPLADISPEAKIVVAIASALGSIRRRLRFEVNAALQPKEKDGPGLTVGLICEKSQISSTTLWHEDYGASAEPIEAFQELAAPAAGWIEHLIAKKLKTDDELRSQSPQSWALFRAGLFHQNKRRLEIAAELYEDALTYDLANVGALVNLGVITMEDRKFAAAEELLRAAMDQLPSPLARRRLGSARAGRKVRRRQDWYTTTYNLAALHVNWADAQGTGALDDGQRATYLALAHEESRKLALTAVETLTSKLPRAEPTLRAALAEVILPAALLIYAGSAAAAAETGRQTPPRNMRGLRWRLRSGNLTAQAAMAWVGASREPTSELHFRFACAYAHRTEFGAAIERLRAALNAVRGAKAKANLARGILRDAAFDRLLRRQEALEFRAELESLAGESLSEIERSRCPAPPSRWRECRAAARAMRSLPPQ